MKVLVTGGSGLVGRYVVDGLSSDMDVDVLDVKPYPKEGTRTHSVDVLDLRECTRVIAGYDGVVHLAGIPHPLNDPPDRVFQTNTMGTFNVLEACAINGVKRFVFVSSESTLGLAFSSNRICPRYFPIDEEHPLAPQDPYGLSKAAAELLCAGYARRVGMRIAALRPPWIWVPEDKERALYQGLVREYAKWPQNLWAFVHVYDLVDAIRRALGVKSSDPFETFFITADENWTGIESRSLISHFFPETARIAESIVGAASLISSEKAKKMLGYQPSYSVADILGMNSVARSSSAEE